MYAYEDKAWQNEKVDRFPYVSSDFFHEICCYEYKKHGIKGDDSQPCKERLIIGEERNENFPYGKWLIVIKIKQQTMKECKQKCEPAGSLVHQKKHVADTSINNNYINILN